MNKTRKFSTKRTLLALMLSIALIGVQAIGIVAYAADEGTADQQEMVQVSTYDELVAAIDAAQDGDVIGINDVVYIPANVELGSTDKHVTLKRIDTGLPTGLEIQKAESASTINFQNMTFDGAEIAIESFIVVHGEASFENVNFKNCFSPYGGGAVQIRSGDVSFNNCIFENNYSSLGGHIAMNYGNLLKIENCTFKNGVSSRNGGAIYIQSSDSSCVISNSIITNNSAENVGGGIHSHGALTVEDTKIFNNAAIVGGDDITTFGTLNIEEDLKVLQTLYADENIIVKGWIPDFQDDTGASYLKLDFEIPPTEVILAESSLGVAGDSKITGLDSGKYYKVSCGESISFSKADGTLTLDVTESEALTGTEIVGLDNGKTYKVEEYIKTPSPEPTPDPTPTPDPEPSTPPSSNNNSGGSSHSQVTKPETNKVTKLSYGKVALDTSKTEYLLGYSDGLMGGKDNVTKAQFVQIVYRLLNPESLTAVYSNKNSFKDVASDAWYNEAVSTLAKAGLISGNGEKFNPDQEITWGEMVSILSKFAKPNSEWKIITKHWAKDALNTAISYRWFEYNDQFNPDGVVTRIEMLNIINSMFKWSKQ